MFASHMRAHKGCLGTRSNGTRSHVEGWTVEGWSGCWRAACLDCALAPVGEADGMRMRCAGWMSCADYCNLRQGAARWLCDFSGCRCRCCMHPGKTHVMLRCPRCRSTRAGRSWLHVDFWKTLGCKVAN